MQKKGVRTALVWVVLVLVCVLAFGLLQRDPLPQLDYATFREDVSRRAVVAVRIESNEITATLEDGFRYVTLGVVDEDLTRLLSEQGVLIAWGPERDTLRTAITWLLVAVVVLALLVFVLKRAQRGTTNVMQLRRSRARLLSDASAVRFSDVGGCEDAKEQLGDLVDFLKNPERWSAAGVRLPRGVLLEGPPGCGKTLLARAVAGETDANFYVVSASEFVEMFVGVGAARVRDMFEVAAKQAPSVIFIDELDAVGRKRGSGIGAAHDEREQTLNQILVCMDGFEAHDRVVVIAATNRADILDAALLRPGRFDRRIRIGELSRDQRVAVLEIHTRNKKLGEDVDLVRVAERTAASSGADLECLVNEAGLLAVRRDRDAGSEVVLSMQDFEEALAPHGSARQRFDKVDSLLLESTTQLACPTGKARVRLTLVGGSQVEGELEWADAAFVKLRGRGPRESAIVPKHQITTVETLDGTEAADDADVSPDRSAARTPGLA